MPLKGRTAMQDTPPKILIAGGGISGLSTAFYVQQRFQEAGLPVEITLVEQGESLGGKIQTISRDGFVLERGPDSFLARKRPVLDLTFELGLEAELTALNPDARKSYILHKGRLHRMPPGLVLGIPTQWAPFLKTGLISPSGKIRAALDLVRPRRQSASDESLGDLISRRLGREVLDHIAEPLLAGIYAGDTRSLSVQSTFPQFQQLERKYGSLVLGMMKSRRQAAEEAGAQKIELAPHLADSAFLTFRGGLQTLVGALEQRLRTQRLRCGVRLTAVAKEGASYRASFSDGTELRADAAVLALPAFGAAELLAFLPAARTLRDIRYVSVANVVLAFDRRDFGRDPDGSGFVIPRGEGTFITACTWTSSKWLHTAPRGRILLRCYVGRSGEEERVELPDDEIVRRVRDDLRKTMGVTAQPLFYQVTRWDRSMPQYPVGHPERMRQVREQLAREWTGVYLTGAGYGGVGIPDCIKQGKDAAAEVFRYLQGR